MINFNILSIEPTVNIKSICNASPIIANIWYCLPRPSGLSGSGQVYHAVISISFS